MKKLNFAILAVLLTAMFAITTPLVTAQNEFQFVRVEVNDVDVTDAKQVDVQRGETLPVKVVFRANVSVKDVRVKAWIGGYEYDDIEGTSDIFDVVSNVTYRKTLELEIPEDMDARDDYVLHMEVYNDDFSQSLEFPILLDRKRHELNVVDVLVRPDTLVKAGDVFFTTVRLENLGEKKQEDIKVTVSIPELGITQSDYIDELAAYELDGDDEESSQSSNEVYLRIPTSAQSGDYKVNIEVLYNRGHDTLSAEKMIRVVALPQPKPVEEPQALVAIDTTSQTVDFTKGQTEAVYTIKFVNNANKAKTFVVKVDGINSWADVSIIPEVVTVLPQSAEDVKIKVTPNKDAVTAEHVFTASIFDGTELEKDVTMKTSVKNEATAMTSDGWTTLLLGGVLVIIVLAIIIAAFKRLTDEKAEEEQQ